MRVKQSIKSLELKMGCVLKNFYCFYVFMFISTLLPGVFSGHIDAEAMYKLLSWRFDDILTETKSLKSKVDNIDNRLKIVEEKMLETQTTTPNSNGLVITYDRQELEKELKENIKTRALAVEKMLFTEKRLLRDSMKNLNAVFADLKSEIQTHISMFNASIKDGINNIETDFDILKSDSQLEMSVYNKTLLDALSSSNATLQTMKRSMETNIEETETRILAVFDKKQSATQTTLNSLQASLNTLSTSVSDISYKQTYTIQPELKSLSSRISSVSSSLSSESSSLSSRISSLSDRIYEEEKRKVAFTAYIYNQPDSIYLPNERIIFDQVYYNEGSGYSSSSGIFTAPKTGTYVFSVNIEATNAGEGHVLVMINGYNQCEALAEKGYDNTGGCTAVSYVYSGQQVWVQTAAVGLSHLYVYKYRSQFNGFLID